MLRLVAGLALVGACLPGEDTGDAPVSEIELEEIEVDYEEHTGDEPPEVIHAVAWCQEGSNSSGWLFFVDAKVGDPNGEHTIATAGGLVGAWWAGTDEVVFEVPILVCIEDDCAASWRDGDHAGVTCATASKYAFWVRALDRDGHLSDLYEVEWGAP